jgi:hypothetical protein
MSPTPEEITEWRKESHKNWLEDKELNATSCSSKAYENGYLRARTEHAPEIAALKELRAVFHSTYPSIEAQLTAIAKLLKEKPMSATTKLENSLLRLCEHHTLQYKESASISDAVKTLRTQAAKIEALQAEVEALRKDAEWIPVSERLPEDRKPYLVYMVNVATKEPYTAQSRLNPAKTGFYVEYDERTDTPLKTVTHWTPLPKPPIAGEAT